MNLPLRLTALLALLSCHPVVGATFNILNGDTFALSSAILEANTNNQHDTINLAVNVPAGTGYYLLTSADNTAGDDGLSGLPAVRRDGEFENFHHLTINGNGATIGRSTSAGTPEFRIFAVRNAYSALCTINSVTFFNGRLAAAGRVGGGLLIRGYVILNDCTVKDNTAQGGGGGIHDNDSTVQLNRCTLSGNTVLGGHGGAIKTISNGAGDTSVTLTNCTLSGNVASGFGEGIYNEDFDFDGRDAIVLLTNCTLDGADIYNSSLHSVAWVTIGNTILRNSSLASLNNGPARIVSDGYNLSNGSGNGFLIHSQDMLNTDPKLDPAGLASNGGPTQTIALTAGSPAIDTGFGYGLPTDQRGFGFPRSVNDPSIPNESEGSDIGAFEASTDPIQHGSPSLIVTTTGDHDDGLCTAADCTLREAIRRSNALAGINDITFAPGVTGTIGLQSALGTLEIADSTRIIGPGARVLDITGNDAIRVFHVSISTGTSMITGLTIHNGRFVGALGQGAGILNQGGLIVKDCGFGNHTAAGLAGSQPGQNGGTARGAAISNGGNLVVERCLFTGDVATGGGGANISTQFGRGGAGGAAEGAALFNDTSGILTLSNCSFANNTGTGGKGGNNTSFAGGSGGAGSGGLFNKGTMTVTSCTLSGNTGIGGTGGLGNNSFNDGGHGAVFGALAASSDTTVANTLSAGNTGGSGPDVSGSLTSLGHNLIGKNNGSSGFTAPGDQTGTSAAPLEAVLGPLQNNAGSTNTIGLLAGSPAIDKGRRFNLTTDQRGSTRPIDVLFANAAAGDGSDIGAVEMDLSGGADSDGDGMSDDFESFFGVSNPTADADGDTLSNLQEFTARTNPLVARAVNPVLRVTSFDRVGSDVVITFEASAQWGYRLERKLKLTDPTWLATPGVSDRMPETNGSAQFTDPGGAARTRAFYKIRLLP